MSEQDQRPYAVSAVDTVSVDRSASGGGQERFLQAQVVISMYAGYAMFMVLRMAPAPVSNAIIADPALGLDKGDWGRILAMGTAGAVVGKFIGGSAADRLGGRVTFAAGLLVCSLGIAAFSVATSAWMFQAAFFVALLAKSSGWPGMTRIVDRTFDDEEYGRVWGVLSTSSRVGTIVATFGLGILVASVSWQALLLLASAAGVVAAVVFNVSQKSAASRLEACRQQENLPDGDAVRPQDSVVEEQSVEPHPLDGTTLPEALLKFSQSLQFWLIIGSLTALTILWDFLLFLPLFLSESVGMSATSANMTSTAFPVGSFISVLVGGFVFDLLSRRTTAWLMGLLLLTATGCIAAFWSMPLLSISDQVARNASVVLLFVFGLCIAPCYYIPMSVFSIQFGGPHAGFLVALLDAVAFMANAVFYWFAGELAEQSWTQFLIVLGAVGLTSAVLTFAFMLGEARHQDPAATPA